MFKLNKIILPFNKTFFSFLNIQFIHFSKISINYKKMETNKEDKCTECKGPIDQEGKPVEEKVNLFI
jgi:hypothetical protein